MKCGCTFIVLKKEMIQELEYEDDEEHTNDRWSDVTYTIRRFRFICYGMHAVTKNRAEK